MVNGPRYQLSSCVELAAALCAAKRHHHQVDDWHYHLDVIPPRRDPVADLAEAVGNALLEFAERLRAEPDPTAAPPARPDDAADAVGGGEPDSAKLGATQLRILEALKEAGDDGLTSSQVAEKADVLPTNAPRTLRQLEKRGLVTASEGRPVVWRSVGADD